MDEFKETYSIIGVNIKKIRSKKNWTQQELANRCKGTNREKISKMENAREDYMLSTLLDVCEALDVSISTIVENEI